jgi:hypothetical protein
MSMPVVTDINAAMQTLTGVQIVHSEQHKECGESRQSQDAKHTKKLVHFLNDMNPFAGDASLRSISCGTLAAKDVNVDDAKVIGNTILAKMDGKNVIEFKFKKQNQVKTMGARKAVQIGEDAVHIDTQLLFQRLVRAAECSKNDLSSCFEFEMAVYPPALFEASGLPLEAKKPSIADAIKACSKVVFETQLPLNTVFVIDGGNLLQKIPWPRHTTYSALFALYVNYVIKHYGRATVVFDGYGNGPSTKDITHMRRSHGAVGTTILFEESMSLPVHKRLFLANHANKQRFINMLGEKLRARGIQVYHDGGDADLAIVLKGIEQASNLPTAIIGDDTDLLVLLCYHANVHSNDIFLKAESNSTNREVKIWNIKKIKKSLGPELCASLLFGHAFLGCDTTSRIYHAGKGTIINILKTNPLMQRVAEVFTARDQTHEAVELAGEEAMVSIFKGTPGSQLSSMRHNLYRTKIVSNTTHVKAESLPPTKAATREHSLRVYHQVRAIMWRLILFSMIEQSHNIFYIWTIGADMER